MNSKSLRRLAADHAALHSQPLPPNYLFPLNASTSDDLTQLDILLAGPTHTPFAAGAWKLHLTIPPEYPQAPPTAHFRTPIFHPNVDPQTGGVCVETLKRDWDSKLTLRDVLVTISCLLIQPNPDSALNAEAGALIQEDYAVFARRAELMTSIHAVVPKVLQAAVAEAQRRGQEENAGNQLGAPGRRRAVARQRGAASRRSDGSPSGAIARRRQQAGPSQPFILQTRNDDVFGDALQEEDRMDTTADEDSSMMDVNQENDTNKMPAQPATPQATTPRRQNGVAMPLRELIMEDVTTDSEDEDMEPEYPPSPRKSPTKSPAKRKHQPTNDTQHAESSRDAMHRAPNLTPPNNPNAQPLAEDSPFAAALSVSPRKAQKRPTTPTSNWTTAAAPLIPRLKTPQSHGGIFKTIAPSSSEKRRQEARRKEELDAKLWELCGRDICRWNSGDFEGEPFGMKAGRW
ncbi:ubiquitin-conjugating enzyme/RWD-like protein [Neohortaea acidophila]|uniref:Ubiquitin-conjugating enzyme/RWD-like protein n=1 Tax=Neohortaea acidophila TaxID=245834 RepID=A0A6A6Q348_9PEZI|nr:ubiquitin-conjugating enzyme/RWD-like protein [Neohortaea acidophila]KAF2486918.1 ubiquitin-conjugating enzyme/RWD-like protein [Neohortaea acidophila]